MAGIEIQDLRLSFIWVETILDLLGDSPPANAPFAFLGDRYAYAQQFEQALHNGDGAGGLKPPWHDQGKQYFWTYYLEGRTPGSLNGTRAWKALVPFRAKVPAAVQAAWLSPPLYLEAFFYPHGLAFVLSARHRAPLTLARAVDKAFEVRRSGRFTVSWDGGGNPDILSLDVLADQALDALRQMAFGPDAAAGARPATPFTIVTVVNGTGVDPDAPTPDGGEVHRVLEAMTEWRPTYRNDVLPPLADARLRTRTAPPSHVLYGRTRGRAVWFPALFVPEAGDLHSLTCYHRNLASVSLQVESLGALLSEIARKIRSAAPLSEGQRECARRAAHILGALYAGNSTTYRSWSPRAHIEQNNLVADVNKVRDYFNMAALA